MDKYCQNQPSIWNRSQDIVCLWADLWPHKNTFNGRNRNHFSSDDNPNLLYAIRVITIDGEDWRLKRLITHSLIGWSLNSKADRRPTEEWALKGSALGFDYSSHCLVWSERVRDGWNFAGGLTCAGQKTRVSPAPDWEGSSLSYRVDSEWSCEPLSRLDWSAPVSCPHHRWNEDTNKREENRREDKSHRSTAHLITSDLIGRNQWTTGISH